MKIKYPHKTIENYLKSNHVEYKILSNGEIAINSPFVADTTFDLRISVEKQCWHDWESGEGGGILDLVAKLSGIPKEEARKELFKYITNSSALETTQTNFEYRSAPKKLNVIEKPYTHSFDTNNRSIYKNKAINFLKTKAINFGHVNKYSISYTEQAYIYGTDFNNRIIIPTYENDKLVYFQARDYTGRSFLRYKNIPKEIQEKGIILPFYDLLETNGSIFISEGPWEAIKYNGTYMLGSSISVPQSLKIKKLDPKAIYIIPDNDEPARLRLIKNIEVLRMFNACNIYIIEWWKEYSEFKDPSDAHIEDITQFPIIKVDRDIKLKSKLLLGI